MDDEIKCPSCRRVYQIDSPRLVPAVCSRCECELEALVQIRSSATKHLRQCWDALQQSDYQISIQHAEQSWKLFHTREVAQCGLIVSVLLQNTGEITKWLKRGKL